MPLSDKQVVESLLAFYKGRGTDLTYLLQDPVFENLPISAKVAAIKKHAGELYASTPAGLNKEEKGHLLGGVYGGAMSGAGAGMFAAQAAKMVMTRKTGGVLADVMAGNKATATLLGFGALTGTIAGGMLGYLKAKTDADPRFELRNQLGITMKDPSNANAVGVLSVKSQYLREHSLKHSILDRATKTIDQSMGLINKSLEPQFKAHYEVNKTPQPSSAKPTNMAY